MILLLSEHTIEIASNGIAALSSPNHCTPSFMDHFQSFVACVQPSRSAQSQIGSRGRSLDNLHKCGKIEVGLSRLHFQQDEYVINGVTH